MSPRRVSHGPFDQRKIRQHHYDHASYPEWRYWTFSYTPIVLQGFTIGFAISSVRQPAKFDKYTGAAILILIVLGRSATPSICA